MCEQSLTRDAVTTRDSDVLCGARAMTISVCSGGEYYMSLTSQHLLVVYCHGSTKSEH